MNRRAFLHSALTAAAAAATAGVSPLVAAGGQGPTTPEWRSKGKWIIPTNKPNRFNLKVMEFNPIQAPDPEAWELVITGLTEEQPRFKVADIARLPRLVQSSRLKCVQCWSGRVSWEGFRPSDLLKLIRLKKDATWMRVECADHYYDYVKLEDLLHPRTLFAIGMNGEALPPEHGAPLRLIMPHKYGYKSSKIITKLTFAGEGGKGLVADGWPYYSETGDILPGVDHPWEFPDEVRKIKGGEIVEY
jgi:DMSO/TMAO reductase YedYZ molybdopterin-dependent catalytic subunit